MKIRNKLLFGLIGIAFLTVALGLVSYTTNNQVILSTNDLRENAIAERKAAATTKSALAAMRGGVRTLMIEKYRAALEPDESAAAEESARTAQAEIEGQLENYRAQLQINRAIIEKAIENAGNNLSADAVQREKKQLTIIGEIEREFAVFSQILRQQILLVNSNFTLADEYEREQLAPYYETRLLPLASQYEANASQTVETKAKNIENALLRENKIILFSTIVALLIALFVGIYLANSISRPIRRLKQAALEFGGGSFDTRIVVASDDEIGVLGTAFNKMARQIANRTEKLKKSNEQLAAELGERKRAEAALRESEASYRQLADAMPQIVWTARADGFIDYYNRRWFDYTRMTLEETEGSGWGLALHPEDSQNCLDAWSEAVETGEKYKVECRLKRGCDGAYRWHLGQALPVRDAENRIVKWFGACTDIHEQKKIEEDLRQIQEDLELRVDARTVDLEQANSTLKKQLLERERIEFALSESTRRERAMIENALDVICTIDAEGRFTAINPACFKIWGYQPEELIGRQYIDLIAPEDVAKTIETAASIMSGKEVANFENRCRHKNGTLVNVMWNSYWSESEQSVFAVAHDITERRRNKEELQKNLSLLASTFEATADGILVVDRDNRIVTYNGRFIEMWQIPDEIIDSRDNAGAVNYVLEQLINADDFANTTKRLTANPEEKHFDLLEFKDGKVYERYSHPQIMDGNVVGRVLSFRDITERKRAEAMIRQSEEKYRNILETIEEGYFETDLAGVFTFCNEALGNVLGYDTDELLGMAYQHYVDHRNAKKLFLSYVKVYRTGQPLSELNWEIIREDGTRRFLESSITLIRNAAGIAIGFRGLARDVTHRKQTEEALRESENKYRLLIESTSEGLLQVNSDDRTQFINDRLCEMVGYSANELINKNWTQILLDDEGRDLIEQANERRRKGISDRYEIQLKKKSGEMLWVIVGGAPTLNAKGVVTGSMGVFTDITASKQVEEVLKAGATIQRQLAERQSAILDALPAHICLLDNAGNILEVNNEWKQFALDNGYSGINYGVGSNYLGTCENATGDCAESARQAVDMCRAVLSGESSHFEMEYPCHAPNEKRWFKLTVTPLHKEKSAGAVVMHLNISERKRIEEQLLHDAFHDGLTGLANRTLFTDHLQMTIERTRRDRSELFAVLFLDFDRFKVINDSLGHAEGDNLLRQIAGRLESSLRSGDLIARLGGDEFTVLLNNLSDSSVAMRVAERLQKNLQVPFKLSGAEIFISASIGIALSTTGHERAEDMLRDADIAMYRAKAKGKARHQVFDQAMHEQALAQLRIETELRQAVEQKEFCLYYQPIFSLETSQTVGFESLVRWKHSEFGMISPNDFIPIAEDNGLIISLGQWILHESCRQMREWQIANRWASSLTVSVNLSFKQFLQPDLAEQVAKTLEETGLDPKCLKLEITESHVMENSEKAIVTMNRLRALGVELSLDDFGTGYSSLSYLHRLPVKYLKIDRSFVARMIESEENGEIVHTIIKLAQNLKMKVVAEGIETSAQLNCLKNLNCELGQGYYFSKPLEAELVEMFIDDVMRNSNYIINSPADSFQLNG